MEHDHQVQQLGASLHDVPAFTSRSFITCCCSFSLSCIDVLTTLVSTSYPNCPMILELFALGALMTITMLAN
jgi:hypothetical protein